jgi:hypothetical protein
MKYKVQVISLEDSDKDIIISFALDDLVTELNNHRLKSGRFELRTKSPDTRRLNDACHVPRGKVGFRHPSWLAKLPSSTRFVPPAHPILSQGVPDKRSPDSPQSSAKSGPGQGIVI